MKIISHLFLFLLLFTPAFAQTVLVNDFPVSDVTNTSVYRPMVAAAPNGSYAITWGDERYGNTNRASGAGNIFGRIIGSNGSALMISKILSTATVARPFENSTLSLL